MTETEYRAAIVSEALSWLRTPYHHGQAVKGAGVDCALLLAEVYANVGLIPKIEFEYYPADWHMHQNDERYLRHILAYARRVEGPESRVTGQGQAPAYWVPPGTEAMGGCSSCSSLPASCSALPGDLAMYQFGRCTAHGAIVIAWPTLLHSYIADGVVLVEAQSSKLAPHFRGIYRYKEWP